MLRGIRFPLSFNKLLKLTIMEKRNYIPAPIDNKNLVEDAFEDATEIFGNFYEGRNHRENGKRHMVGFVKVYDEEFPKCVNYSAYVDVTWTYGASHITIKVIGVSASEDFEETKNEVLEHYKKVFKAWECEDNPDLKVEFYQLNNQLNVIFYFEVCD